MHSLSGCDTRANTSVHERGHPSAQQVIRNVVKFTSAESHQCSRIVAKCMQNSFGCRLSMDHNIYFQFVCQIFACLAPQLTSIIIKYFIMYLLVAWFRIQEKFLERFDLNAVMASHGYG